MEKCEADSLLIGRLPLRIATFGNMTHVVYTSVAHMYQDAVQEIDSVFFSTELLGC